jgi:hypothetical protein
VLMIPHIMTCCSSLSLRLARGIGTVNCCPEVGLFNANKLLVFPAQFQDLAVGCNSYAA